MQPFSICFCKGWVIHFPFHRSIDRCRLRQLSKLDQWEFENMFRSYLWILLARHLVSNCDQSMNSRLYKKCIREPENLCSGKMAVFLSFEGAFFIWPLTNHPTLHLIPSHKFSPLKIDFKSTFGLLPKMRHLSCIGKSWQKVSFLCRIINLVVFTKEIVAEM